MRHETGNFPGGGADASSKKQTTGNNSSVADPAAGAFNMTLASESIGVHDINNKNTSANNPNMGKKLRNSRQNDKT